jgi:hypothetical protein
LEFVDGLHREFVPFLPALLAERAISELIFVGFPLMKWMMADLHVNPASIHEDHRPEPGAQRDHQLDTAPADASQALHIGVIRHPDRLFQALRQLLLQRIVVPSLTEIGRSVHYAIFDHARKTHRDAVEIAMLSAEGAPAAQSHTIDPHLANRRLRLVERMVKESGVGSTV